MKLNRYRILFFVNLGISVLICFIIFMFSAQNGNESGNVSEGLTRNLFPSVVSDDLVFLLEKMIRKIAHYGIYFILGIFAYFTLWNYIRGFTETKTMSFLLIVLVVGFCFIYSISDELHQSFVPGRNGSFKDCCLDTFGALTGVILISRIKK